MFFVIHGQRTARIKRFTDHQQSCSSCKTFALTVSVYRDYYHLIFIPILPVGDKTVTMRCSNCGEPLRSDSLQKQHIATTRTPFYLYALLWLLGFTVIGALVAVEYADRKKIEYINHPKVGDVYLVGTDSTELVGGYYYLRVSAINKDTVFVYHSNYKYLFEPSDFGPKDYFVREIETSMLQQQLKAMLERGQILEVNRNYSDGDGFNRVRPANESF